MTPDALADRSLIERLVVQFGARRVHDALTPAERTALRYCWPAWERPSRRLPPRPAPKREPGFGRWSGQQEPPGAWLFWLYMGGRGIGKSRRLTQFVNDRAKRFPGCRIAVVARTARSLWGEVVEGESGLLAHSPPWFMPRVQANKMRLVYPNDSKAILFTAEEPENLRGPNNAFAAVEELAAQPYHEEVWRQLQMTMRSGRLKSPIAAPSRTPRGKIHENVYAAPSSSSEYASSPLSTHAAKVLFALPFGPCSNKRRFERPSRAKFESVR